MCKRILILLLSCVMILSSAQAVTFTDALGREITVENPKRVAAMIGSFADIWCLAGGAETVVAAASDTWTYWALPIAETVADIGPTRAVSLETLIAAAPDFILASANNKTNIGLLETFEAMGMNVAYFNVESLDDYLAMLDVCTQITGHPENLQIYGEQVRERAEAAIARADGSHPEILYLRASSTGIVAKGSEGNVLGEMLARLGCINIADQAGSLAENLSMETIMTEDPDYIFVVIQGSDSAGIHDLMTEQLFSNPAWSALTAVREGRVYEMDQTLYNLKPNERWGEAYEALADILYPLQ